MASVRVAARVRPLIKREKEVSAKVIIHMEGSTTSIDCNKKHLSKGTPGTGLKERGRQSFSYDFSYDSTDVGSPNFVPQEKVFKDLGCDVLEAAFDGYNACVFAYGQTGSGKSHTMMGSPGDIGLIPRICEGLFCQISEESQGDGASFRTEVSYLEIYNERVQDLLTTKKSPENGSGLKVREHPKDGPYVEDLSKHLVQNYRDIEKLLHAGKAKRTTSSTGMNDVSSRSHAIFTINFTQARFDAELPCEMVSKIHLVDLAGSERADATCATGARLKEGANINKSLVTLGIVISALGDGGGSHKGKRKKQHFIPYRDSVLTWLLKDSLGGNSKTIMIATLSPADVNYSETLSTLHYANRAKNIVNKPTVNEDSSVTVIRKLQEEIVRLKGLVEKNNQARLSPQDLSKTLKVEEKLHKNEVKVLELTREWTNKWGETQNILKEETVALRKQGIGVVMDSKLPHLIGINDDLLSTGIILYHLKEGRTLVGRDEASSNPDIVLHGAGLLEEHCVFENRDGVVTLIPQTGALCSVNRLETTQPCQLTQGAVIQLGRGTIFRFNHPKEAAHLREQRKSGLLSSLSLTDFSRLFHSGMDVFAVAGENGDYRQQRSSVLSQLQTCTVLTETMSMEAPVSVSRHPSACYAVPLQIGAGAPQHLQAVSSLHAGVNRWSFGAAEGRERPCSSANEESQRRARASPVHRTGTPTLTPTALEQDSLQQGLEGEVEEWDSCHQSGSGVGVSDRWLERALLLRRAREEGGLYWGEEAWSGPGDRDEERNRALQQTPVLLVQQADVYTVGPEGLPGPANKSPGVLSGLPDGCRVLGGVLATDCCRRDLSRAGARYGGPAGTSLGTAVSYLQRGDGGGIDGWTEERTDRAHLPQASSSSTYTQTSPSRFDTHTPSMSQLDNHSQATHTATRQDRHRRSQAVRGLPLEALEGQFSRVMMDRFRMTVEGHRENDKEGEAGARREEVEQSFRLGALVSRVFREKEKQFSVSGLSALVRRVCQISGIGGEQELDSLGEEVSGMGSLVSRGLSWMFPDTGSLRSSTPRILQQVWEGTGVLHPGAGGGASSNWSSQVVRESQVLSVVKDSQVFSLVRESRMYSLVRDSQVFSMVSELPFVHHISTELTQDFRIIHNELTQVLQPVESTGLQQKAIDLNTTPEIKLPLVHNTVLSTVPSLYPAHNTIEFANKQSTGKEVDWRAEDQSPISELACTSEQEGREEALAKSEEQSPVRELQCTSDHEGGEEAPAKSEEPSSIREVECTSELEGREEALTKSEEPSPIREVECTLEQEGKEEALAKSEEQRPITELECTSENEGREEALAKSEEQRPITELECTSENEGGEEALAKSEEQRPITELECTSENEGKEEALAKSEEQRPITELECTSENEGKEEALAKSEEQRPITELECTSENEGGEEALAKSEEQSITKEALWPSKDQIEIVEDQHCVTCGAKSTKSQPPPEQRNNTSSTGPENIFIPGHGNQRTDDVQVYYGSLVEFPGALVKLQSLPVSTLLGCLQSVLPSVFTSQRLLALYWLGVTNCSQPHPHLALVLLLESCLYALTFDPDTPDQTTSLTVFHHLPLLQIKEILVGFGSQSLRLKAYSEECVLTLYTHSQTLTQALTHTLLGVLCPGDQRVSQHPLLVENLMVLSLDWKAQAPDLLLNDELRLSGQFHKTLADLVYLVHGNMNREKPHLGEVRLLLYTSVGVTTTPDPRPDPWAQLLLTDTHLGLVQEDTVFHPAPHHVPLLSRQAQFKGVTLRCLSDVRCVIVRDGVGSSTSVGGDGAGDEGGATRLDIILSQDWRTRRERPRGHPERGAVAEADGSAVGGVAGASVLSAASNSCPPQQQAEVWKLHFSCSSEAACLINHLSNV
ncbi:uncharacterized protein [Salvelinus alpinus]|uniref:uncharacterized protein isoform X2 n=1 Tax=Salvelinus alpinus TaxID=8036 RepID=UPI0039FC068F